MNKDDELGVILSYKPHIDLIPGFLRIFNSEKWFLKNRKAQSEKCFFF